MAVVLLAAFLLIACLLALRFEKQLTAVLPSATCILILTLYVLAFFRRLSWIDYFSTAIVVGAVLRVLFLSGEKKKKLFAQLRELFFAPSAIAAMVLLTGAVLLTGNKIATWWDDLNFWATDVKALYALDGFAAKYTNAASEFGDYPPGIQLLKWWFVHLKPDGFSEGLMFAGYYFGVFVFLTPLLSRLDESLQTDRRTVKQLFWTVVLVVCLAAFPSMTETFYLGGMCADLVMAVIYGVILMSCLEDRAVPGADAAAADAAAVDTVAVDAAAVDTAAADAAAVDTAAADTAAADTAAADTAAADTAAAASRSRAFSNLRIALYLGVLVLVKSVGFLWAAFALVFVWFWRLHGAADKKKEIRQLLCITAFPAVSGGSWMLFCLLMKRVAKLTGAAVSMASGSLPILLEGTVQKLLHAYAEAFAVWALHQDGCSGIGVSALALFVIFLIGIAWLYRRKLLTKTERNFLFVYVPLTGIVFYGINLVSHLTIFATETQYLEAAGMIASIERYSAPFTVGTLYLLFGIFLERSPRLWGKISPYAALAAAVLLCANWGAVYDGMIDYRQRLDDDLQARSNMITEASEEFLEKMSKQDVGSGMRVLYLKNAQDAAQWVRNTYISFEASPVSVLFGGIGEDTTSGQVWELVQASHAGYLYADETDEALKELFAPYTEEFAWKTLYRIQMNDGTLMLEKAEETRRGQPEKEPNSVG